MNTHYHYRNGVLERIELCFDGAAPVSVPLPVAESPLPRTEVVLSESTDAAPMAETAPDSGPETPQEAAPDVGAVETPEAAEADVSAPSRLRGAMGSYGITERLGMGTVRSGKMGLWGGVGEAAAYGVDNIAKLGLPTGTGFAVGCVLYGVNRAIFPDSKL